MEACASPRSGPDPRIYQVLFLGGLLAAGALMRDFSLQPVQMLLTFATGLGVQWWYARKRGLPAASLLSASITCFGLSIHLRSDTLWAHPLTVAVALAAKFHLKIGRKHIFNPGNLAAILGIGLLPGCWISGGQWGRDLAAVVWIAALGMRVTASARRMDISLWFLVFYLGLFAARVLILDQRPEVFLHRLTDGALLLYAFFMISDPMTIPNHPRARIWYALQVAALAYVWNFHLYRTNGTQWALFASSLTVPLWDRAFPASKFEWRPAVTANAAGGSHDTDPVRAPRSSPVPPRGLALPWNPVAAG